MALGINPTAPHIERAWFQGLMPKTLKSVEKFVLPLLALGELFGAQEQHGLDESGFDLPAGHEV